MARYLDPEFSHDSTDDVPALPDLSELARLGEQAAGEPLTAATVRRLGTSRRRRRHAGMAAGALALVVLAGGVAFGTTGGLLGDPPPEVVASPGVPTPSPERTVTAANLITAAEIASITPNATTIDTGTDGASTIRACGDDGGYAQLGASSQVTRTFRPRYEAGAALRAPNACTVVLQFGSADAAGAALEEYQQLFDDRSLWSGGTALDQLGFDWTEIDLDGNGSATVAEYVYRPDDMAEVDGAIWESHALIQVGDRLALTVYQNVGPEWYAELDVDPVSDGAFPHPQLALTQAATKRLQD